MKIPFFNYPDVYKKYQKDFQRILEDVGNRGAFIMQEDLINFENKIAKFSNCRYAIGVANATDALEMLLKIANIDKGNEVIISTHTMIATASAIASVGAIPVPIECGQDHLIDHRLIEEAITSNTKVIMPTQLNGRTAKMDEICDIANKHELVIIEDSAQALGSKFNGRNAGTFGLGGCISFYPAKVLGCLGDGGMILCNDSENYEKLIMLRDHGRDPHSGDVLLWGRNSRLDNLQSAFLEYQFQFYENTVKRRRQIADIYHNHLLDISEIILPPKPTENNRNFDVFQNYEIEAENRNKLQSYLFENEIGTLIQWGGKGVHQFSALGFNKVLPFSENIFDRMLLLPINMSITNNEVEFVCNTIKSFYKR